MPEPRQLVVAEADRRSAELLEDLVERVGVDGRGQPVADGDGTDRDPGLGAPGVGRQVVGQLGDRAGRCRRAGSVGVGGRVTRAAIASGACGRPPAELGRLRQPVERLHGAGELDGADARAAGRRGARRGAWSCRRPGAARRDDERDAAFDQHPERRRQLRIERAGTDQLDDRARRRWDVADGPPAPPRRGLGHGRSVRPGPGSVKRAPGLWVAADGRAGRVRAGHARR